MPSVDTQAEARELVATQDENPLIDLAELPLDTPAPEAARVPVRA
jgi:MHS family proline/betaine transporter-like MFS transporter